MKSSSKYLNVSTLDKLRKISNELGDNKDLFNSQLLFLTSYGIITGDLVDYDGLNISDNESTEQIVMNAISQKMDILKLLPILKSVSVKSTDTDSEVELVGDGSILVLENVKICRNSLSDVILSINIFYLHANDILGFSLIPR